MVYFQIYSHGVTSGSGAGAEWCRALLHPPGLLCSHPFFLALLSCVLVILRLCSHAGKYVLSSIEHMEISTQTYTSKYK